MGEEKSYTKRAELKNEPKYLFISPHLDDAVWSCFPIITKLRDDGFNVEIWTIMADLPKREVNFSAFSLQLCEQDPVNYFKERISDDIDVCNKLKIDFVHFSFLDAIFRSDFEGEPLYPELNSLFNQINFHDITIVNQIFKEINGRVNEDDIIVCPSASCGHVDHILTRIACEMLPNKKLFYDEFPYTLNIEPCKDYINLSDWEKFINLYSSQSSLFFSGKTLKYLLSMHYPVLYSQPEIQTLIPRIIHLIWVGDAPMPPAAKLNYQAWQKVLGKSWQIKLWTNDDLNELKFSRNILDTIQCAPHGIQKADILRYQIMSMFGGWYFDLDFEPIQSIDPLSILLCKEEIILCNEDEGLIDKVSNGFFACSKGNLSVTLLAESVLHQPLNTGEFNMAHIVTHTGPIFFNSLIKHSSSVFLPSRLFYPVTFSQIIFERNYQSSCSFAKHIWHNRYSENKELYFDSIEIPQINLNEIQGQQEEANIMLFCFMKDEAYLLSKWIPYHAALFGIKNIMIIDHGSEPETKFILEKYSKQGLQVYDAGLYPFTEKGQILTKIMRNFQRYKFLLPMDADEFLCLYENGYMICDKSRIQEKILDLPDKPLIFKLGTFDVCNFPDKEYDNPLVEMQFFRYFPPETDEVFSTLAPSKSFYPGKYFISTDDGNHLGTIEPCIGNFYTELALAHFHTRGYMHFLSKHAKADKVMGVSNLEDYVKENKPCFHWIERTIAIKNGEAKLYFDSKICSLNGQKEASISNTFLKLQISNEV